MRSAPAHQNNHLITNDNTSFVTKNSAKHAIKTAENLLIIDKMPVFIFFPTVENVVIMKIFSTKEAVQPPKIADRTFPVVLVLMTCVKMMLYPTMQIGDVIFRQNSETASESPLFLENSRALSVLMSTL